MTLSLVNGDTNCFCCSGIRYHMKTSKHEGLVHTAESWAQYEEMMEKERLHQERKQHKHDGLADLADLANYPLSLSNKKTSFDEYRRGMRRCDKPW
jgi:hypothetical protein